MQTKNKTFNNPALAALRHHVTGAIERGESQAIVAVEAPQNETGRALVRVLSIDAWRECDGGWTWNNWHKIGEVDAALCDATPRQLFRALRDAGYLSSDSAGRVAREDDGHNVVINDRATGEPLIALEYGAN